ncbi:hypothetical protein [Leptolyngbya sp. FACHB-17]|uniref:hypothetical protein n=2 Tax=unclassified Leptolyngbya TaxID=2650499 RepID=UPI0016805B91|nr:hypothetical protein [Leptolyngbya sp. FACHB-17]
MIKTVATLPNRSLFRALNSLSMEIDTRDFPIKRRRSIEVVLGSFSLTLQRVIFLDLLSSGLRPADPFDAVDWTNTPIKKRLLDLEGDISWTQLQVLNQGFDLIREAATNSGYEFRFSDPRALFVQILKDERQDSINLILTDRCSAGMTLEQEREMRTFQSKLFRGRASQSEETQALEKWRSEPWLNFCLYGIWHERFRHKPLREAWEKFLKAHKAYLSFLRSKEVRNRASNIVYNYGQPVLSKTMQPVRWAEPTPVPPYMPYMPYIIKVTDS